jgi:hypothetical protein
VAEEHGGSIEVKSRVGEGTTFIVRLERWSEASAPTAPAIAEDAAADPTPPDARTEYPQAQPTITDVPGEATT